jgi:hypothetical protein
VDSISESISLAEVAKRVPNAVVCLISALQFHNLTTQIPHRVWIAIENKNWKPKFDYPLLEVVRFSGRALSFGVEEHEVNRVPVKVYSPAKTVADCFKFRNKIGLDVAMEALRETWRSRKATMDELWEAACGECDAPLSGGSHMSPAKKRNTGHSVFQRLRRFLQRSIALSSTFLPS